MPAAEINESRHERKLESLSRSKPSARSNRREGGGEGRQSSGNLSRCGHFRFSDGGGEGLPPLRVWSDIHISAAERRSV